MSIKEKTINKIIEKTNVSAEKAEIAFELADFNVETTINLLSNKIIFISGKTIINFQEFFGLFLIKFFTHTNFIQPFFLFSRNNDVMNYDLNSNVFETEKYIQKNYIFADQYFQTLNNKLSKLILSDKNLHSYLESLINVNPENSFDKNLTLIVKNIINTELNDEITYIEVKQKVISQLDYEILLKEKYENDELISKTEKVNDKNYSQPKSGIDFFIKCEPKIISENSKEKWKFAEELAVGNFIYLLIADSSPQSQYLFKIISLDKKRIEHKFFKSIVKSIDNIDSENIFITCEVLPGVYSKIKIKKKTKVKANQSLTRLSFNSIILMIVIFFIIIIISLYFIYYFSS